MMINLKDIRTPRDDWFKELNDIFIEGDGNPDLVFPYVEDCMDAFEMKGMFKGAIALSIGMAVGAISSLVIQYFRSKKKSQEETEEEKGS